MERTTLKVRAAGRTSRFTLDPLTRMQWVLEDTCSSRGLSTGDHQLIARGLIVNKDCLLEQLGLEPDELIC